MFASVIRIVFLSEVKGINNQLYTNTEMYTMSHVCYVLNWEMGTPLSCTWLELSKNCVVVVVVVVMSFFFSIFRISIVTWPLVKLWAILVESGTRVLSVSYKSPVHVYMYYYYYFFFAFFYISRNCKPELHDLFCPYTFNMCLVCLEI